MKPALTIERWLYRKDGNDYGPVSTDALLEAMVARQVDLGTPVFSMVARRWTQAGEHALFRDFYEKCELRWRAEAFDTEAEAQVRRLARARQQRRRAISVVAAGTVVTLAVGAWIVWRLGLAEPMGLDRLARLPVLGRLPVPAARATEPPALVLAEGTVVPLLAEPETYDTAGVALEGAAGAAPAVTKMSFTEDGGVLGIAQSELDRVLDAARRNLHPCALDAAKRDAAFRGTRIGFVVAPGRLTSITVSDEVKHNASFKACVKSALARVSVPQFEGGDRHVTIPIAIGR